MIGVVLWCDHEDQKAVFWCEDHGDLAYFNAAGRGGAMPDLLSAGDMVAFDLYVEDNIRCARDAKLVKPRVCKGLQDHLRASTGATEDPAAGREGTNVVSFPAGQPDRVPVQARSGS